MRDGRYNLYMVVTNDKYELPVCLGRIDRVAEFLGVKEDTVRTALSRSSGSCGRKYRVIKTKLKGIDI